jgi:hypothetical protein
MIQRIPARKHNEPGKVVVNNNSAELNWDPNENLRQCLVDQESN